MLLLPNSFRRSPGYDYQFCSLPLTTAPGWFYGKALIIHVIERMANRRICGIPSDPQHIIEMHLLDQSQFTSATITEHLKQANVINTTWFAGKHPLKSLMMVL
jgi:hypothetical protein